MRAAHGKAGFLSGWGWGNRGLELDIVLLACFTRAMSLSRPSINCGGACCRKVYQPVIPRPHEPFVDKASGFDRQPFLVMPGRHPVKRGPVLPLVRPRLQQAPSERPEAVDHTIDLRVPDTVETIDDMVLRYGPRAKHHSRNGAKPRYMIAAWIGDRLLGVALGILVIDDPRLSPREQGLILHEAVTNAFLSRAFTARWAGVNSFTSIHDRGTVMEAALYGLYQEHGMEAVLKIVRLLLEQCRAYKDVVAAPQQVAELVIKPDGRGVFVPRGLHLL